MFFYIRIENKGEGVCVIIIIRFVYVYNGKSLYGIVEEEMLRKIGICFFDCFNFGDRILILFLICEYFGSFYFYFYNK